MCTNGSCKSASAQAPVQLTSVRSSFARRWQAIAGWIVPSGGLMLLPKCPACLAAYIAVVSGVGISASAATYLRILLLTMCIASITYFAATRGWRLLALVAKNGALRKTLRYPGPFSVSRP